MTTKIPQSLLILAAGTLLCIGSASGQKSNTSGASSGQVGPRQPRVNQINQREANQQSRIANGIKNHKLTPGQASRLEKGEQRLENNKKKDMAKDNGHLASSIAKPIT